MGADQFARYFKRMKLNDKVVFFTSTDHLLLKVPPAEMQVL